MRYFGVIVVAVIGMVSLYQLYSRYHSPIPASCVGHCNVVLIVIDTLSAEHIQTYGYGRNTMPHTAAFFEKRGIIFDDVTSGAAWTFPSFAATYFSDLPSDISFLDYAGQTARPQLFTSLRDAGVSLHAIRLLNSETDGTYILDAVYGLFNPVEKRDPFIPRHKYGPPSMKWDASLTAIDDTALAIRYLSATNTTPFFTMTHLLSVHDPYAPAAPYSEYFASTTDSHIITMNELLTANAATTAPKTATKELYRLRYDQQIAETDDQLERLFSSLSTSTLQDTAIIVMGDHGEAFYEHGHFFHGISLYQPEVRVPLFMYIPGILPRRVNEPVSLLDIAPTILSLQGAPIPASFRGRNLLPILASTPYDGSPRVLESENGYPFFLAKNNIRPGIVPPPTLRAAGVATSSLPIISALSWGGRLGRYKLIASIGTSTTYAMFDEKANPQETYDLLRYPMMPSVWQSYVTLLAAFRKEEAGTLR